MTPLDDARIVLAVTGGVAAYKAADLASNLVQAGARLEVILTKSAEKFVGSATFNAIIHRRVHTSAFETWTDTTAGHVTLAAETDLLLVVPATAASIARLSLGLADDLLGLVALSTRAPIMVAPAMEHGMLHHTTTQQHLDTLRQRGVGVVWPGAGRLASGAHGDGRLADVDAIIGAARQVLGRAGQLTGKHLVVTAGGTQEAIDPVRFIGNRSSGAMGVALAQAALDRGAAVTLVIGPTNIEPPSGAHVVTVESAAQMLTGVTTALPGAAALIMAAAVADFRPSHISERKIKKQEGDDAGLVLELVRNPDILATVHEPSLLKVGFAAETDDLLVNAAAKLRAKGLAMIVANDAVATIGSDDATVVILRPDRAPEHIPLASKASVAAAIVDRVAEMLTRPIIDDRPA